MCLRRATAIQLLLRGDELHVKSNLLDSFCEIIIRQLPDVSAIVAEREKDCEMKRIEKTPCLESDPEEMQSDDKASDGKQAKCIHIITCNMTERVSFMTNNLFCCRYNWQDRMGL